MNDVIFATFDTRSRNRNLSFQSRVKLSVRQIKKINSACISNIFNTIFIITKVELNNIFTATIVISEKRKKSRKLCL